MGRAMTPREPRWPGPALLVPIGVEALPVTGNTSRGAWSWSPPNYGFLAAMLRVDAAPFTSGPPSPPGLQDKFRGVILHWALPDGLTAGREPEPAVTPDGVVAYPAVPNRWLVSRKMPAQGQWTSRAWIVASDYLGAPNGAPWPPDAQNYRTLGTFWPVDQWPGEAAVGPRQVTPPLTAVGPGDPGYAAFVPNVPNVFSFADELAAGSGPISYSVVGWYSDSRRDPLYGAADFGDDGWQTPDQWRSLMARLGWSVGGEQQLRDAMDAARAWAAARGYPVGDRPHAQLPARTLCHGTVQGVPWAGPDGVAASGVPTVIAELPSYVRPRIAVAHTGVDALAALIGDAERERGGDPERVRALTEILTAFQLDLLPKLDAPDGTAQLAAALQQSWFSSRSGGTVWEVVATPDAEAPAGDSVPPLTDEQRRLLTALNRVQADLDQRERSLASMQWELYALWWKGHRARRFLPPPEPLLEQIRQARTVAESGISDALATHSGLRAARDQAAEQLRALLDGAVLVAGAGQPFWAPSDPVIMVSGVHRGHRHGADGRFTADGTLLCRFTGQTVDGLAIPLDGSAVRVGTADLPPPAWPVADLPWETSDLLAEAFFLDVDDAPVIAVVAARKGGVPDSWSLLRAVRTEQTLIWNPALYPVIDHRAVSRQAWLTFATAAGAAPSPVAMTFYRPPWSPLYLDWAFDFYPGCPSQRDALANWELPGQGGDAEPLAELGYRWRGAEPPSEAIVRPLAGRTVLTAQITDVIARRLRRLIADHADDPAVGDNVWALNAALDYLQHADLLSQAATGFTMLFRERAPEASLMPADGSLDPFLDPPGGPSLTPDSTPRPPMPETKDPFSFRPIRNGHLRLTRLWAVDAFGQVFKIIEGNAAALPRGARPVLGGDLTTAGDGSLAELKPRISQHARIILQLLSAISDDVPVGIGSDASPVCGWIIASPLDRALLIYAADGRLEGSLLEGPDRALWSTAPDRHVPSGGTGSPGGIGNAHLRSMVTALLDRPDSAAALRGLLALINEAGWSIDPADAWDDEGIPALQGYPLALVRARLSLGPYGRPDADQAWDLTGDHSTAGFDAVRFPVQLGCTEFLDDGLVGYFLSDDYRQINTVYDAGESGYVARRRPHVSLDGSARPLLTLLMDPRAEASVISGILPVLRVTVPAWCTLGALARMAVTLRTGPVLTGPADVAMPLPAVSRGAWSWLQHQAADRVADHSPVTDADATAGLPTHPATVREGWLRLDPGAGPTVLDYTVTPPAIVPGTGPEQVSGVLAQISAYNGSGHAVRCDELTFTVPVGYGSQDLTADPRTVVAVPPGHDWTFAHRGDGVFTARPAAPGQAIEAGRTLTFGLSGIRPNPVAGRVVLRVAEAAGQVRTTTVAITKVPQTEPTRLTYTVEPQAVPAGHDATLHVTACNATGHAVRSDQIVVTLPAGTGPAALTEWPERVDGSVTAPGGWTVSRDGAAAFVIDPVSAPGLLPPGAAITLRLDGVAVGGAGAAVLSVRENTAREALAAALVVEKVGDRMQQGGKVR
jgi:hypothetical protein